MKAIRTFSALVLMAGLCLGMTQNEALTAWPKTIEHTYYLGQFSRATVALMVGIDGGRFDNDAAACTAAVNTYSQLISNYPGPLDDADVTSLVAAYKAARTGDAGCP